MPNTRLYIALSTSVLGLGLLACTNDNDPLGVNQDTGGEDSPQQDDGMPDDGDDESGPDEGGEGCDSPDPACTTNAACGNQEICVQCECVPAPEGCDPINGECIEDSDCGPNETCGDCVCLHACQMQKMAQCSSDSACDSGVCDPESCTCEVTPTCDDTNMCQSDTDCPGATCDLSSCLCTEARCECGPDVGTCAEGESCDGCLCQAVPGTVDPTGDCDADGTPVECTETTDLVGTDVACDAGTITTTAYFEFPVEPAPVTSMRRIVEYLDATGYLVLRLFASAPGGGGPYECSVIVPGVMMTDLGPGDVCEINPDGSFAFALSPQSAMLAVSPIATLFARSESGEPYHYDDGDPIDNPCL